MPPTAPTPQPAPARPREPEVFQPVAAVLAILIPGAGHVALGEVRRGILIFAGVLGLFFGGIFIGGIDVVDRREDFVWFLGQALVGPIAFGVDKVHQEHYKVVGPVRLSDGSIRDVLRTAFPDEIRDPNTGRAVVVREPRNGRPLEFVDPVTKERRIATSADRPPNVKSLGRTNEMGTLFATIAGMLNLICIIDAAFHRRPAAKAGKQGGGW